MRTVRIERLMDLELIVPRVQDYILVDGTRMDPLVDPTKQGKANIEGLNSISIALLPDETLEKIAVQYGETLKARAAELRRFKQRENEAGTL